MRHALVRWDQRLIVHDGHVMRLHRRMVSAATTFSCRSMLVHRLPASNLNMVTLMMTAGRHQTKKAKADDLRLHGGIR